MKETIEDYLKIIFQLEREEGKVATTVLARRLGLAPGSVTGMLKKLSEMNLVNYTPYQGVRLTASGKKIALEVIRHHRLIELFLAEALGVPWDRVHEEAEKWEHVLSEDLEDRIDEILGYPTNDPHGSPIPDRSGAFPEHFSTRLSDLEAGQKASIAEVADEDPELLRYLADLGLFPNTEVRVEEVAPFEGPITVQVGERTHALGRKVAHQIFVKDVKTESEDEH
ncbi:MAG: metal-dependent transcriptional regulator [Calditrichaeota bacterium]|nr:MAG: metal-dependent transcriptional regulator [Calditrichota bacterium]